METPTFSNATYTSNSIKLSDPYYPTTTGTGIYAGFAKQSFPELGKLAQYDPSEIKTYNLKKEMPPMADKTSRRIVQIFIVDPDEKVDLNDCILFQSEQFLTDATDSELYFEKWNQDLLVKHNEKRAKTLDKKASEKAGKDIFLEPIKIRNLTMTTVDVAKF